MLSIRGGFIKYFKVIAISVALISVYAVYQIFSREGISSTVLKSFGDKILNSSPPKPTAALSSARTEVRATTSIPSSSTICTSTLKQATTSWSEVKSRNIFYNRVGKCGSRSLSILMRRLGKLNNISVSQSPNMWDDHPKDILMLQELRKIAKLKPPAFYNRHIHYLDFEKHGFKPPIYINMIRDPVSRFVSGFNYAKYGDSGGKVRNPPKNLSHINECILNEEPFCIRPITNFYYTNYFCGFDPVCNGSTSERVELAKKHIEENYLMIGLTEEFENTLKLLEKMIPDFFNGALSKWKAVAKTLMKSTKTKTMDFPNEEAIHKLRHDVLSSDYDVYTYAKAKFEKLKIEHGIV